MRAYIGAVHAGPTDRRTLVRVIVDGLRSDLRAQPIRTSAVRALRSLRVFGANRMARELLANEAFCAHVHTIDGSDWLCFLSHRSYLARGLSTRQRTGCALSHYGQEMTTFDDEYRRQVYRDGGLVLWVAEVDGVRYSARLTPGNDVLYEGGLSVVLFVDEERVCVVSHSRIEGSLIGLRPGPRLFITRKQLTPERGYQAAFNSAFDRATPAHLCIAALTGVALALGDDWIAAIRPRVHPSFEAHRADRLEAAYSEFWESLSGRPRSAMAYEIAVPLAMTPLSDLTAKARKRAMLRRQHLDAARDQARVAIAARLVDGRVDRSWSLPVVNGDVTAPLWSPRRQAAMTVPTPGDRGDGAEEHRR
jgi:uncharacterized protein VirK/YbjX